MASRIKGFLGVFIIPAHQENETIKMVYILILEEPLGTFSLNLMKKAKILTSGENGTSVVSQL